MNSIHCEIYGHGRPLLMLHGWAMHSGIWRQFARQLAEQRQVICLDLPGHGRSAPLINFEMPAIVEALLAAIPVPRFDLLGWSLGATVAINLACSCPGRVRSLTLLAGNPRFVREPGWPGVKPEVLDSFAELLIRDSKQTLQRFLGLQVQGLPHAKTVLQQLKLTVSECEAPDFGTLQGGLQILKQHDARDSLAALKLPIRVIQGDKDTLVPVATATALQDLQPALQIEILPGAGHVPFLTHPQVLADAVLSDD
ncbi:pimeloyl-ACP methyl ester esterase BioH [Methylomonas sp. EFPC3]|uniref:pimeloyl-ACP methyl ester esterase BioH n=1 Tax=Methylomonas sp. EFPC3 TaxID=3021710 RepID=UPI002417E61E|nr:pimeloyl-ACP methyl ester esterase BioH [Methylomonas sp. EFPC3]WFP50775.1 pimeloyl-ACP methyl ester esterase BioH [Methylomonas sp. EFPC3]